MQVPACGCHCDILASPQLCTSAYTYTQPCMQPPAFEAQHWQAIFRCSKNFRQQQIYLADDFTSQQLHDRRSLTALRLELERLGLVPWWPQSTLHWLDGISAHHRRKHPLMCRFIVPAMPCASLCDLSFDFICHDIFNLAIPTAVQTIEQTHPHRPFFAEQMY